MESKSSGPKDQRGDLQFPWKLHLLLEHAEKTGQDHIVSWLPNGKAFRIHDKNAFAEELMLSFFSSSKFKSFQRNLNLWGFETISRGTEKGVRFHTQFIKGKPDLCRCMTRTKVKGLAKLTNHENTQNDESTENQQDIIPENTARRPCTDISRSNPNSTVASDDFGTDELTTTSRPRYHLNEMILSDATSQMFNLQPHMHTGRHYGGSNSTSAASINHLLSITSHLLGMQSNLNATNPNINSNQNVALAGINADPFLTLVIAAIQEERNTRQLATRPHPPLLELLNNNNNSVVNIVAGLTRRQEGSVGSGSVTLNHFEQIMAMLRNNNQGFNSF